jgi:hypothetical protein
MKEIKKIYIQPGYTTVWKKDKQGKLKPIIVKRKGYIKSVVVKK